MEFKEFSGEHTAREAAVFIKKKINEGTPVPYLWLRHKDKKFADFVWHWFLCIVEDDADDLSDQSGELMGKQQLFTEGTDGIPGIRKKAD